MYSFKLLEIIKTRVIVLYMALKYSLPLTTSANNGCMSSVIVHVAGALPVSFYTRIIEDYIVRLTEPVLVSLT